MQEQWMEIVVTRLLSLGNPFLIHAVLGRLSARLACKVIDAMELKLLLELNEINGGTDE